MNGFEVDLAELTEAARQVDQVVQEIENEQNLRWYAASAEVGHAELAHVLSTFQDDAQRAATLLETDGREVVNRLKRTADGYGHAEERVADIIRRIPGERS